MSAFVCFIALRSSSFPSPQAHAAAGNRASRRSKCSGLHCSHWPRGWRHYLVWAVHVRSRRPASTRRVRITFAAGLSVSQSSSRSSPTLLRRRPTWWDFSMSADRQRIESFLRRAVRSGLWELAATTVDESPFRNVLRCRHHVGLFDQMLPPKSDTHHNLRKRRWPNSAWEERTPVLLELYCRIVVWRNLGLLNTDYASPVSHNLIFKLFFKNFIGSHSIFSQLRFYRAMLHRARLCRPSSAGLPAARSEISGPNFF